MRGFGPSSFGAQMKFRREPSNPVKVSDRIDFSCADPILVRRMFSSRVLKELANGRLPAELSAVLEALRVERQLVNSSTLSSIYEQAFKFCLKHQRVEYFYKNAVVQKLVLGRSSLKVTAAYLEVRIAEAKLDVLLARDHTSAYEIKTDFDELVRLPSQLSAYQRACRRVSVVTSDRYASAVERLSGRECGIYVLTDRYQLRTIRAPEKLDSSLVHADMLALLRRKELIELLRATGRDGEAIPNTRLFQEALVASSGIDPVDLNSFVASRLLERSTAKRCLVAALPVSLAASALAQDLTRAQIARLTGLFEMDVTGGIQNELSPVLSG